MSTANNRMRRLINLFSNVQAQHVVALKPLRQREQEAPGPAANVDDQRLCWVLKSLCPVLGRQLHLQQ
jgi:hypothetical protein